MVWWPNGFPFTNQDWRLNGIHGMCRKPRTHGTQRILRFASRFFSEGHLGPIIKGLNYGRLNLAKACKWIKIPVDPREYTWSISTIYQQSTLQVEGMFCDENDVPSYLKQLKRRSLTFTMDHISPTPRLFQRHASQSRRAARMTVLSPRPWTTLEIWSCTTNPKCPEILERNVWWLHTVEEVSNHRSRLSLSNCECWRTMMDSTVVEIASTCTMEIFMDSVGWP